VRTRGITRSTPADIDLERPEPKRSLAAWARTSGWPAINGALTPGG
jgi:hypothetical protein